MPIKMFREFIKFESSAGIILFAAAVLALVVDNTPLHVYYRALFSMPLGFHFGILNLSKPLLLWVNDGFMAIFFLLVGLEIKREIFEGELNSMAKSTLPIIAAVGGMVCPALIYIALNKHSAVNLQGWAIPTATDIAFSLGILSLLGKRIPVSLKIFLTALAIFDDIGAIVIIAVFYTRHVSIILLFIALGLLFVLLLMNKFNVVRFAPYMIVGFFIWLCVLKSGVHATLAGIVVAFMIPLRDKKRPSHSPLRELEHQLHPWVAYGILPIFAFANAGVSFVGMKWPALLSSIPLGIALGLFVGKQIGIWLFSWLAIQFNLAKMPRGMTGTSIYGVGLIAGIGFTMSLFIGTLAFGHNDQYHQSLVRMGVIIGSFLSGVFGYYLLKISHHKSRVLK
ncbi:MAG: Na+/H+ antiporter NhaA [Gammaproteobacteria bacterium]|nr:Na+/H+ antiporter NhaA [Gammaproteobacteria bacterium]MCH9744000.1 Na+/H+ antiporter NhaA [Gammaproteobacteria bacterium]